MDETRKLPPKNHHQRQKSDRNWKAIITVIGAVVLFAIVLTIGIANFTRLLNRSPTPKPPWTSLLSAGDANFCYFENFGDIAKITVPSLTGNRNTVILPAENTTVEQSVNGYIVLKAEDGQFIAVNGTSTITIFSSDLLSSVAVEMEGVRLSGFDRAMSEAIQEYSKDESKPQITVIHQKSDFLTVNVFGTIVTIADVTDDESKNLTRSGLNSTRLEIAATRGTTIFERRNSEDVALTYAHDANRTRAQMLIRPSLLYVREESALGTLHVDPAHVIYAQPTGGSRVSASFFENFGQISNANITFNASIVDGYPQLASTSTLCSLFCTLKDKLVLAQNGNEELQFKKDMFVSVRNSADKWSGKVSLTEDGTVEQIELGTIGKVHRIDGVISEIFTNVANLTRPVDEDGELYNSWHVTCSPWDVAIRIGRAEMIGTTAWGYFHMTYSDWEAFSFLLANELEDEYVALSFDNENRHRFQLKARHAIFSINRYDGANDDEMYMYGVLARISVTNFENVFRIYSNVFTPFIFEM